MVFGNTNNCLMSLCAIMLQEEKNTYLNRIQSENAFMDREMHPRLEPNLIYIK